MVSGKNTREGNPGLHRDNDPSHRAPHDPKRINMQDEWDVRYWMAKFEISRERLKLAVDAAGPTVEAVQRRLSGN